MSERALTGRHVLFALLAFFVTIIAVNIAFAVAAVQSFPGEDVRRSYLQGLEYNTTIAERRAQAALGWRAVAELTREPDGRAVVEVELRTREGAPLLGAAVTGQLRRAATARFDRDLVFTPVRPGRYAADVGALQSGRWLLRAEADEGGRKLDFEAELAWRSSP